MRESVIYQDILQQGRKLEIFSLVMRLLVVRFGEVDSSLIERVQGKSIEQLEALVEALFQINDVSDLVIWLNEHS